MSTETINSATAEFDVSRRRRATLYVVGKVGRAYVLARTWRVHLAAPGMLGAGLVSAGVALRFGVWAGLIVAGAFCLRLDSRIR